MRPIKLLLVTFFFNVTMLTFGQNFEKKDGRQMALLLENALKQQDSIKFIDLCFIDTSLPSDDVHNFDSTEFNANFRALRLFLAPSFKTNTTFSKIEIKKLGDYEKLKNHSIYSLTIWYPSKKTDYIGYTLYLDFVDSNWKIRSPARLGTKDID